MLSFEQLARQSRQTVHSESWIVTSAALRVASPGGGVRIAPGTQLPAPVGVFPRYVEPSAA